MGKIYTTYSAQPETADLSNEDFVKFQAFLEGRLEPEHEPSRLDACGLDKVVAIEIGQPAPHHAKTAASIRFKPRSGPEVIELKVCHENAVHSTGEFKCALPDYRESYRWIVALRHTREVLAS